MNSTDDLPSPLAARTNLERAIAGRDVSIFLDYDGTLTPIVREPELAVLSEETRSVLQLLSQFCPVAVVSGRDLQDVTSLVGLTNVIYAGSHGFDISGPDLQLEHEDGLRCLAALDAAEASLGERLAGCAGVRVERKRFAIAVHYRNAAPEMQAVVGRSVAAIAAGDAELRATGGKKVYELRPDVDWDKGRAVLWLLEALGLEGGDVLPIYIGDDMTDEDAFSVVAERGIGILVADADRATKALYRLDDPGEVREFLGWLAGRLAPR